MRHRSHRNLPDPKRTQSSNAVAVLTSSVLCLTILVGFVAYRQNEDRNAEAERQRSVREAERKKLDDATEVDRRLISIGLQPIGPLKPPEKLDLSVEALQRRLDDMPAERLRKLEEAEHQRAQKEYEDESNRRGGYHFVDPNDPSRR